MSESRKPLTAIRRIVSTITTTTKTNSGFQGTTTTSNPLHKLSKSNNKNKQYGCNIKSIQEWMPRSCGGGYPTKWSSFSFSLVFGKLCGTTTTPNNNATIKCAMFLLVPQFYSPNEAKRKQQVATATTSGVNDSDNEWRPSQQHHTQQLTHRSGCALQQAATTKCDDNDMRQDSKRQQRQAATTTMTCDNATINYSLPPHDTLDNPNATINYLLSPNETLGDTTDNTRRRQQR